MSSSFFKLLTYIGTKLNFFLASDDDGECLRVTFDYAITNGYVDESLMGKSMRLIVDVNYPHVLEHEID